MSRVVFRDVVKRINVNVDRHNTERLYYVGGEHIDSCELLVTKHGLIAGSTIGFKFHFGFEPGHILFMSRNPHLRKASMATFSGICSDSTYVVETRDENVLLQKYLLLEMQSDRFWEWAEANKSGGVNYLINYKTLDTYEFDLPSLEEQKALAEKLWAAYEVKQSYLKMIEATQEMVKAQFMEMFMGCSKIGLGELATFINGSAFKPEEWSTEGLPIVRIQNLNDESSDYNYYNGDCSKKVEINNGDILVSWSATLGVFLWNKGKALLNQHIFKVVFDKVEIDKEFFVYTVSVVLDDMSKHTHGSTMKHIVKSEFDKFPVAYPSIDKQKEFARIAHQSDNSISELRKSIDAIDKVIKSLINENL